MQVKEIKHELRQISIAYDETIQWTDDDNSLLQVFLKLHDEIWQEHQAAEALVTNYLKLDEEIVRMRADVEELKKTFTNARGLADHILAAINLKRPNAMEAFAAAVNETNDKMRAFDGPLKRISGRLNELDELQEKFYDARENNENWWQLSETLTAHGTKGKRNAIDYVRFDDEQDRLRGSVQYQRQRDDERLRRCDDVVDNYNRLMYELEIQYEVWAEFGKRLLLIEQITSGNEGRTTVMN